MKALEGNASGTKFTPRYLNNTPKRKMHQVWTVKATLVILLTICSQLLTTRNFADVAAH